MNRRAFLHLLMTAAVASVFAFASPAPAAPKPGDDARLKELREQFKKRFSKIQELKRDGVVGETSEGYLDFVNKKSGDAAKLVDAENKDRKELYVILAAQEGVEVEVVAERNAKRNFDRARPGEYLREEGKWKKKEK